MAFKADLRARHFDNLLDAAQDVQPSDGLFRGTMLHAVMSGIKVTTAIIKIRLLQY